uniref:NADH-ubiquinone oxidoreductase chain 4 n=1 Tax=Breviceps mossambicus TaxID=143669 RepID=A0A7I6P9I2_9NEOB|nr:NADH dehydrogenase subunit 4 [Breviceps mossambicus]
MLMITLAWFSLILMSFLYPKKSLWILATDHSFMITIISFISLHHYDSTISNHLFIIDQLSAPLALLTCWLFPLMMLASQNKTVFEPEARQRLYIANAAFLQLTTLLAFTTSDMFLFFIYYETSLIPTMIIITRWGPMKDRLIAGNYIVLYTLVAATPFLIFLITFYSNTGTLSLPLTQINSPTFNPQHAQLLWLMCNLAFLAKMPLYALHLWLTKAHVEAPIAGSMVLAGTLLKLGGYGLLRFSTFMPVTLDKISLFLTIALFGIVATAFLCLRQTDLKSLIALSSVSHMNLVIAAAMIQTPESFKGATIMMIAHGLASSAFFCLANSIYELTQTRIMSALRGTMLIFPLASIWWLFIILMNMALPPSINFISELINLTVILANSPKAFMFIAIGILTTTAYSIYVLSTLQWGPTPKHLKSLSLYTIREHILLALHVIPAVTMIIKPQIFMMYGHSPMDNKLWS